MSTSYLDQLFELACQLLGVKPTEARTSARTAKCLAARHAYYYAAVELNISSRRAIGALLHQDATTVTDSWRAARRKFTAEPDGALAKACRALLLTPPLSAAEAVLPVWRYDAALLASEGLPGRRFHIAVTVEEPPAANGEPATHRAPTGEELREISGLIS